MDWWELSRVKGMELASSEKPPHRHSYCIVKQKVVRNVFGKRGKLKLPSREVRGVCCEHTPLRRPLLRQQLVRLSGWTLLLLAYLRMRRVKQGAADI